MGILQLPKRLHRDFRLPGVKPVGPVEIDWAHPRHGNVVASWQFSFQDGGASVRDIAVGPDMSIDLGTSWKVGPPGRYLDFNGTNQNGAVALDLSHTDKLTLVFEMEVAAYDNDDRLAFELTNNSNNNDGGFFVNPRSGAPGSGSFVIGTSNSGNFHFTKFTRPSTGWHKFVVRFDRSITHADKLTVDGVEQTPTYAITKDLTGSPNFANDTFYLASRGGSSLWGPYGFSSLTIIDDYVSDAEARSLSINPYQLLKPVNAPVYFIPAAGGGTAHSLTLSESIGASAVNSALWAIAANTPESIAATSAQSASADFAVSASESASASSAQSSSGATAVTVSESINATSTQAVSQAAAVSVGESVNAASSQSASAAFATAVAEAVAAADIQSISFALESSISEALVSGSAQASVISIDGAVSESIGTTSTQSAAAAFAPSVAFSTAVAESVITAAAYQTSYADSIQAVSVESIGIAGETVSFTITVQRKTTLATHVATATLN